MAEPGKRKKNQAAGWPKGWEVIGGDVVDYEAALFLISISLEQGHCARSSHQSTSFPRFWKADNVLERAGRIRNG